MVKLKGPLNYQNTLLITVIKLHYLPLIAVEASSFKQERTKPSGVFASQVWLANSLANATWDSGFAPLDEFIKFEYLKVAAS